MEFKAISLHTILGNKLSICLYMSVQNCDTGFLLPSMQCDVNHRTLSNYISWIIWQFSTATKLFEIQVFCHAWNKPSYNPRKGMHDTPFYSSYKTISFGRSSIRHVLTSCTALNVLINISLRCHGWSLEKLKHSYSLRWYNQCSQALNYQSTQNASRVCSSFLQQSLSEPCCLFGTTF